jgi:hypothetical protein
MPLPRRGPDREDGIRADARAEGAARTARGVCQLDRVVAECVDPAPIEGEDGLGASGDTELAALAVILGDDERRPRPRGPDCHGNWTDRHSLFAFECGARSGKCRRPHGPWQSRVRDLLTQDSRAGSCRARAERLLGPCGPAVARRHRGEVRRLRPPSVRESREDPDSGEWPLAESSLMYDASVPCDDMRPGGLLCLGQRSP